MKNTGINPPLKHSKTTGLGHPRNYSIVSSPGSGGAFAPDTTAHGVIKNI